MASKVDTAVVGESVVPKAPTDKKKSVAHPPYIDEAISCLKERNGSSQYAIAKFIQEKHKDLPPNFKKVLLVQLRKLVASAKLTKLKNSFKLSLVAPTDKKVVEKKKVGESTPVKGKKKGGAEKKAKKVAKTEKVTTPGKKKVVRAKKVKSLKSPAGKTGNK